jgi:hypothetical protein
VATLGGEGGEGGAAANPSYLAQAERAEAMAECLRAADIPATTFQQPGQGGQKELELDTGQSYLLWIGSGGMISSGDGADTSEQMEAVHARQDQLRAKYKTGESDYEPHLIIGEADFTEALAKCLEETGYTEPDRIVDPSAELQAKQRTADATATWAECARANGYPSVKDPAPPKADEFKTSPAAVLPGDITDAALLALLERCPPYPRESLEAALALAESLGPKPSDEDRAKVWQMAGETTPNIGFDLPGWDGSGAAYEETDPDFRRGLELGVMVGTYQAAFTEQWEERMEAAGYGEY